MELAGHFHCCGHWQTASSLGTVPSRLLFDKFYVAPCGAPTVGNLSRYVAFAIWAGEERGDFN